MFQLTTIVERCKDQSAVVWNFSQPISCASQHYVAVSSVIIPLAIDTTFSHEVSIHFDTELIVHHCYYSCRSNTPFVRYWCFHNVGLLLNNDVASQLVSVFVLLHLDYSSIVLTGRLGSTLKVVPILRIHQCIFMYSSQPQVIWLCNCCNVQVLATSFTAITHSVLALPSDFSVAGWLNSWITWQEFLMVITYCPKSSSLNSARGVTSTTSNMTRAWWMLLSDTSHEKLISFLLMFRNFKYIKLQPLI